jgi:hypothetical protein
MNEHLHILQHSLGVDQYGDGPRYRNHFVTGPESLDHKVCLELVSLGFMQTVTVNEALTGGEDCFSVTRAGIEYMLRQSPVKPPEPKLTRGQKNYQAYLRSECDATFREWMGFSKKACY